MDSLLLESLAGAWAEAVGRTCVNGGLLVLLLYGAFRLFPKTPLALRRSFWWLACLKFVVGVIWLTPVGLPVLPSPAPAPLPSAETVRRAPIPVISPRIEAVPRPRDLPPLSPPSRLSLPVGLFALWMAGVGIGVARLLLRLKAAHRTLRAAAPLQHPRILDRAGEAAFHVGLTRIPPLFTAPDLTSPLIAGGRRARILLPASALDELSDDELRMTLAHEMAHLRRGDLWLSCVPEAARILFFFFPPAWLAAYEWSVAAEAACDQAATSVPGASTKAYGRLLLRFGAPSSPPASPAILGQVGGFHPLRRRFLMLSHAPRLSARLSRRAVSLLALAATASLVPWRLEATPGPDAPPASDGATESVGIDEKTLNDPAKLEVCKAHFTSIQTALAAYRKEKGDYPDHLSDLVPQYLKDKAMLHCPNDPTTGSDGFNTVSDPKLPASYIYEMKREEGNPGPVWLGTGKHGKTWRAVKLGQMEQFGEVVPVVRCRHHGETVLNLSASGEVYAGEGVWEYDAHARLCLLRQMNGALTEGLSAFQKTWDLYMVTGYLHMSTYKEKTSDAPEQEASLAQDAAGKLSSFVSLFREEDRGHGMALVALLYHFAGKKELAEDWRARAIKQGYMEFGFSRPKEYTNVTLTDNGEVVIAEKDGTYHSPNSSFRLKSSTRVPGKPNGVIFGPVETSGAMRRAGISGIEIVEAEREASMHDPAKLEVCKAHLTQLWQAIQAYQKENGSLPRRMADLFPRYIPDKIVFRCPAQSSAPLKSDTDPNTRLYPSYYYEFDPTRSEGVYSLGPTGSEPKGENMMDAKLRQMKHYGDLVPILRCPYHGDTLNLGVGGTLYQTSGLWETDPRVMPEVLKHMERDLRTGAEAFQSIWGLPEVRTLFANMPNPGPDVIPTAQLRRRLLTVAGLLESRRGGFPEYKQKMLTGLINSLKRHADGSGR